MHGRHQARVHSVREHVARPARGYPFVQAPDVRHPAAEHDHIGVDDVDDARQRPRHPVLVALERGRRLGALAPAPQQLRNHHRTHALRPQPLVLALADRVFALERGAVFHQGPAEPLLTNLDYRKRILWV